MRRETLPLYAGGFLGPFGGAMLIPLIPTVAAGLDTSVTLVAASITAYMIPFSALQLVSGTIAGRVGAGRIVLAGYVGFGGAAVLCALAPGIGGFIVGRAAMGVSNAFLSPILLASLSAVVPGSALGRAVGTFAAVQVTGLTLAPVLGGAFGELSWRLAFVLVAGVAFLLALVPLRTESQAREAERPTLRMLLDRWIGLLSANAFLGYLGFTAIGFVVALVAEREFGLGPGGSGLVVATYGAGGMLLGRLGGSVADRIGRPQTAFLGATGCALGVLGLAFAPSAWSLALVYFGVGCASAFAWAGLNTIAVESFPRNRAGTVSAYGAFKFFGVAVAPLVYVPLLNTSSQAPFLLATALSVLFIVLLTPWFARYRVAREPARR